MGSWHLNPNLHIYANSPLLLFLIYIVGGTLVLGGVYREDEREALLAIKSSIPDADQYILPTWVDDGSSEYCDWERIKCDTTSHHVTHLYLGHMFSSVEEGDYAERYYGYYGRSKVRIWPLKFSVFLPFKELTSLDLSWSYIGNIGLEGMSGLKKLEILNLSTNFIETNIFPSINKLTSLKILDLSYMNLTHSRYSPSSYDPIHDISDISSLENLEVLDLTHCGFYGTLRMQASNGTSMPSNLKILNLGENCFNESFVASLHILPSLKALDLSWNIDLLGSFPFQALSNWTDLEKLDLSVNDFKVTPSIEGKWLNRILEG